MSLKERILMQKFLFLLFFTAFFFTDPVLCKEENRSPIATSIEANSSSVPVKNISKHQVLQFWKILFPFLLVAILLLLSHYAMRQYNKRLKQLVEEKINELEKKDELLIQQHRMAAMGEMLSMISHQWKQPLGAINSAIMGIKIKIDSGKFDLSSPSERKKFISYLNRKHASILEYVDYLSHTTDDFRNFFDPGKSKEMTSLNTPIENALNIVQKSLKKNGIEVITDFKTEAQLMMYPNEVMQVMINLLKNAEDNFLEKKTPNPKIMIGTFLKEEHFMIRVCDNGGGIPEETAKHIFEPYFSTKNNKMGTGLGLYMSKIIMENHHYGSLLVRNVASSVCFELIFPRAKE
ncbi:MAG TPA: HAMP domain-containing histidine kinase [Sulfurovum sp.]|nr:HAMP domain-containing histidine kinase [Sulfurovum sp.]